MERLRSFIIFVNEKNKIHPNMKFTMKHTTNISETGEDKCDCNENKSISFLDTSLSIKGEQISVDLYRKPQVSVGWRK